MPNMIKSFFEIYKVVMQLHLGINILFSILKLHICLAFS